MKLAKLIKVLTLTTCLALIYIHMQMQIFALAYQGKKKADQMTGLQEANDRLAYNILELKSSQHLGGKLLDEHSRLRFRDQDSVKQVVVAQAGSGETNTAAVQNRKANAFLSFLPFKAPEARAEERQNFIRLWQKDR